MRREPGRPVRAAPVLIPGLGVLVISACAASNTADFTAFEATLPAGAGRGILIDECLNCHELTALELFQDFYNESRWRSLVITMRGNGAELDDREVDILARYLAINFGTGVD